MRASQNGFTLLELLVAISIFSILGLSAYQLLQTVSTSHDKVRDSSAVHTDLNLAFAFIQRDLTQFTFRPVRDAYGDPQAPLVFNGDEYLVEFTRGGWNNPTGRPRSRLQRVAYSLDYEEKTLTRHFWEVLDRAEDSEPRQQIIMTGVTDFAVSGISEENLEGGDSGFDLEVAESALPVAVEVTVVTDDMGEVRRVFQLVDTYQSGAGQNADNQAGGENQSDNSNPPDNNSSNEGESP